MQETCRRGPQQDIPFPSPHGRRVFLRWLGCRTNQEEVELLRTQLRERGFHPVDDAAHADIAVVNTCTVTAQAEAKARRLLAAMNAINPRLKFMVTGCLAQRNPEEIRRYTGVSWVVGNGFKGQIPDLLSKYSDSGATVWSDVIREIPAVTGVIADPREAGRTRFALKIQEGCDHTCAYCIVPSVRGNSRSVPAGQLREAFGRVLKAGYREIVLTGTHIGQYHDGETTLAGLIGGLTEYEGDYRIRLSSLDPRDLTPPLCDLLIGQSRLCDHLHLSIQSLCDDVLRPMNRGGCPARHILDSMAMLVRHRPNMIIGADFIVGFPGETPAMFEETLAGVVSAKIGYGHVFRYSPRPGTPAVSLQDHVPETEKTRRSQALRTALQTSRRAILQSLVGTRQRILIEQEYPACGLTSNYVRTCLPHDRIAQNAMVDVSITGIPTSANRRSAEWSASITYCREG